VPSGVNPKLAVQKVRANIAQLKATQERQRYELLEMEDRRLKTEENIEATDKAIEAQEQTLRDLEEAHGSTQ
jgi:predicted  nucleic acid-binding Zn-ribbon protein